MKRLISFLYDPLAGRYRFFGCLQHTTGVVCGEILKHLLIAESAPHYFEIWVGGKEPQFKLNKHTNVKYEPISVYHGGMNQLLYKKVETATWGDQKLKRIPRIGSPHWSHLRRQYYLC